MICIICKKKIIEKKERWVRLTDFNRGIIGGEQFYHLECWRDRFKISNTKRKQEMYNQFQKSVGKIIQVINPNQNKVYEIQA